MLETIDSQLRHMGQDLKDVIEQMNSTASTTQEEDSEVLYYDILYYASLCNVNYSSLFLFLDNCNNFLLKLYHGFIFNTISIFLYKHRYHKLLKYSMLILTLLTGLIGTQVIIQYYIYMCVYIIYY